MNHAHMSGTEPSSVTFSQSKIFLKRWLKCDAKMISIQIESKKDGVLVINKEFAIETKFAFTPFLYH